ncbi:MAG TPA: hypothetical protein DDZ89_18975 [Clostridiales bacterium]|nr:hypothetical protein [Clostridiales bacterium]
MIIRIYVSEYQKYVTPVKLQRTLEPGINNLTVTTLERGKATIKGTVYTEHGETLSAATVTVYCDTDGGLSIPYSVLSDANGKYSLEVLSGKARVVISHTLSRSKEFTIEPLLTGETRKESFWFPIERKILMDIKFKDIGEPEGYNDLLKEQKVKLTVTNKGTLENPKNDTFVTARGDDRYLSVPNAEPGDIIEVVVDGQSAGYDIKTVLSSPLDENCWAVMNIQLSEAGKVRATFADLYGELNYPVYLTLYRQNGEEFEYVTQISTMNQELVTSPLLQGRYNIFVHTKPVNMGIRYQYFVEDVGDNGILYSDVDVTNGVITFIGESIVKKYEDTGWGCFRDNEGNEIRASMTDVVPGGMTTITVSYKYFDTQPLRKLNFFIDIPEGSTYIEDSIKITPKNNSKTPKPYFLTGKGGEVETINLLLGGSLQLPLGDLEGSVSFNIRFDEEPGNIISTARYYAKFDGVELGMREHIGEVIFSTPHVSIYAEADIFEHTIPVSGRAPKNAIVKIYDSAYFVGEAKANQHGLWSTTVTLPDRGMPNNHYLSAQIQNKAGDPVTSEIIECSYDTDRPRITKIEFGIEGMFKKVIKKNETFRYRPEDGKKKEVEIYFDDATRIRDVRLMTATGYILVNEEDVVYHEGEHKFSASWLTPVVTDEIRVSYRVAKPEAKLSDYAPVAEDVLRSGLSDLWGKSTFIQQPALSYNESNDTFEIHSKVMLGDKNSVVSTTMEISNYEGELPPGYSNDADLPIGNLFVKFYEDETFEISFIMPRDVLFQEVMGEKQDKSQARLMSAASIPLIATRVPQQLVRVFGKKTVIEAGLDSYSLVDTFLGGHSTAKFLEKVYALENEIKSPCYNQQDYYSYQDRRDIALLEHDTKFLFGAKSVLSIAFLGLGFIPVVGWGAAIGLAVATTVAGYLVDKGIEAYQEKQYEDLRGRIRGRAKPGCHWPRDNYKDNSDTIARPRPFLPIDPSGYVYEGVASNRLPGVVTTAYELIEEQWQVWDAEWFAQENPLITNEIGFYQWDVPEGWWMVKYEKEGYEIAYSDKLPVPPPQLDVNIAMVSKKLPEVTGAVVDHEGKVTLTFSQYMDVSYVNVETFKLYEKATDITGNLIPIAGSITAADAEANPVDANLILARTFVFTPALAPKVGDIFTLWVDDMPVNYAGRSLVSEYTADVTVPEKQDLPPEEPDDDDDVVGSIEPIIIPERQVRIFNIQLKDGEDPNTLVVYRKDAFGNLHIVKECYYDPVTKMMRFVAKPATIYITGINPVKFDDMGTWADEYIMFLAARGIIHGIGNNKFEPDRSVTRAEFIKLLASLAEDDFEQGEPWYMPYINWALERSVITHKDMEFNQPLSREDMAIWIANFAQSVKLDLLQSQAEITFKDQEMISQKARDAVTKLQKAGILEGKPDRLFDPKGSVTRAEAAKIITTLLKMMVK